VDSLGTDIEKPFLGYESEQHGYISTILQRRLLLHHRSSAPTFPSSLAAPKIAVPEQAIIVGLGDAPFPVVGRFSKRLNRIAMQAVDPGRDETVRTTRAADKLDSRGPSWSKPLD
jgi:hypothetical protein